MKTKPLCFVFLLASMAFVKLTLQAIYIFIIFPSPVLPHTTTIFNSQSRTSSCFSLFAHNSSQGTRIVLVSAKMATKSCVVAVHTIMAMTVSICSAYARDFHVGGKEVWVLHPKEKYNHRVQRMNFQATDYWGIFHDFIAMSWTFEYLYGFECIRYVIWSMGKLDTYSDLGFVSFLLCSSTWREKTPWRRLWTIMK